MEKEYPRRMFYMSQETLVMLEWMAKQDRRNPSWIVRELIAEDYKRRGGPAISTRSVPGETVPD